MKLVSVNVPAGDVMKDRKIVFSLSLMGAEDNVTANFALCINSTSKQTAPLVSKRVSMDRRNSGVRW
jgi:hypothetical protein